MARLQIWKPAIRLGRIMRILVTRRSFYPARAYPAATEGLAAFRVTDLIVKGLAELGHEVYYQVELGSEPMPGNVRWISNESDAPSIDVAHRQVEPWVRMSDYPEPWVKTCHADLTARGFARNLAEQNWIFVSRTLADSYGSKRYVLNGIDPSEFIFSETKENYFLFVSSLDRAEQKGLDVAVSLLKKTGARLVIAGSASNDGVGQRIREMCAGANVELAGEALGARRAELFAGAKALLFPTQINEGFGMVMTEALMSGTPVICSNRGACREIISSDVGFVCDTEQDFLTAMANVGCIQPATCRAKALREYHYLRMAEGYLKEYEREIGASHP